MSSKIETRLVSTDQKENKRQEISSLIFINNESGYNTSRGGQMKMINISKSIIQRN